MGDLEGDANDAGARLNERGEVITRSCSPSPSRSTASRSLCPAKLQGVTTRSKVPSPCPRRIERSASMAVTAISRLP
jgi:hypothetical protein